MKRRCSPSLAAPQAKGNLLRDEEHSDDELSQPIGSVCPEFAFTLKNTEKMQDFFPEDANFFDVSAYET